MANDDFYREEIQTRLGQCDIYVHLKNRCDSSDFGAVDLLSLVNNAVYYCYHRSKLVMRHMGEFTLHDGEHLFRVLKLMGLLIPVGTLNRLSNPELALLILTAFFHDVGMAPAEQEVKSWLGIWDQPPNPLELDQRHRYLRFRSTRPSEAKEILYLNNDGRHSQAEIIERYLITEYIRITHADRAVEIIGEEWAGKIKYRDVDLTSELALLCKSHNEDGTKLLQLDTSIVVGQQSYVCLPFIGVVLRICDLLDFDGARTPSVLFAHLGVKDPVSLVEWAKHRSVDAWTITPENIIYKATCTHPAIQYSINAFCDYIDHELISCSSILNNLYDSLRKPFPEYYSIHLPRNVDRSKIKAKTDLHGNPIYIYRDTKFTLSKEQIVDILMGTKLYAQPNVALRELIQNSIDACKLRLKMEESWGNKDYKPQISVTFSVNGHNATLEVADNGVGMDQEIIDKFYSKIGASYYTSREFLELKTKLKSFVPTSRFGIGILSCFMVSDSIEVETKKLYGPHNSSFPLTISVVGQESVFYIKNGRKETPGTITRLRLKSDNPWRGSSNDQIIKFVKQAIPFPPFEIQIKSGDEASTHNIKSPADIHFLEILGHDVEWTNHRHLRQLRIEFDGSEGITGACMVAILEKDGMPVNALTIVSRQVMVEGQPFEFKAEWRMEVNRYVKRTEGIDPESIGTGIKLKMNNGMPIESKSAISLHGVEIPSSMFSHWMGNTYQQAKIHWPLCLLVNIDIGNPLDINLNSARTEILVDEKWFAFEDKFAELIGKGIRNCVSPAYWDTFKAVTISTKGQGSKSRFVDMMEKIK